jgi:hypothetical protein
MRCRDLLAPLLLLIAWALLILRVPIAVTAYDRIDRQLSSLVLQVDASLLPQLGIPVQRNSNSITILYPTKMQTAVVCRCRPSNWDLLLLATLAVIYGYFREGRLWVRWLLLLGTLPFTISARNVRLITYSLLYWSPDQALSVPAGARAIWISISILIAVMMLITFHLLISFASKSWSGEIRLRYRGA